MTYITHMNDHHRMRLEPIIERAEALDPGQSVSFRYTSPQYTESQRQLIYGWMHLANVKSRYKLVKLDPLTISIRRSAFEAPVIEAPRLSPGVIFAVEELCLEENESDVLRLISEANLEPEDTIAALEEWRRMQEG